MSATTRFIIFLLCVSVTLIAVTDSTGDDLNLKKCKLLDDLEYSTMTSAERTKKQKELDDINSKYPVVGLVSKEINAVLDKHFHFVPYDVNWLKKEVNGHRYFVSPEGIVDIKEGRASDKLPRTSPAPLRPTDHVFVLLSSVFYAPDTKTGKKTECAHSSVVYFNGNKKFLFDGIPMQCATSYIQKKMPEVVKKLGALLGLGESKDMTMHSFREYPRSGMSPCTLFATFAIQEILSTGGYNKDSVNKPNDRLFLAAMDKLTADIRSVLKSTPVVPIDPPRPKPTSKPSTCNVL